jgi:hypothetical protein
MANPVVKLRPVRRSGIVTQYAVWCTTDDCEYADVHPLKTGAQSLQRDHARRHRARATGGGR